MQPTRPHFEPDGTAGFEQAETLEALVVDDGVRPHQREVQDLVLLAEFLAPELHRAGSSDDAAEAITEWADGDPDLLSEAETVAREEHHEESAELLHEAAAHARAA
ncbi:MAG TPA: hypothetical protein VF152_02705 [Acidimicrobiia bacterium]